MAATDTTTIAARQVKPRGLFQRVRSNVLWSAISEFGGKGILFLVTVYLARVLDVENYGLLSYAQTMASYFWLAVDLGVNMYGPREIAREKGKVNSIANDLLTLRIVSGIVIFITFLGSVYLLVPNPAHRVIFIGCAFYLVARSINTDWVFRGLEKFKYIAVGNLATFSPMLVMMLLFVNDKGDAATASFIWSLSYFLGGLVLFVVLHKVSRVSYRPIFHLHSWSLHLRESIHFTISGSLLTLYQYLPIIYLGLFAATYEVGLFSASYKLVVAITYAISIIPLSLYPIFSELYAKDRARFAKLHLRYQLAAFFLGAIVLIAGNLFSEEIITMVYGIKYAESVLYFRIMLIYIFFFCIRSPFGIVIAAAGLQKYYSFASAAGVILLTSVFFTMRYFLQQSFPGAASIALALTELCLSLILIVIWRTKRDKKITDSFN